MGTEGKYTIEEILTFVDIVDFIYANSLDYEAEFGEDALPFDWIDNWDNDRVWYWDRYWENIPLKNGKILDKETVKDLVRENFMYIDSIFNTVWNMRYPKFRVLDIPVSVHQCGIYLTSYDCLFLKRIEDVD
jgi:hypothetical protein